MGDLDEKIDVYSFANNIYCLVGHSRRKLIFSLDKSHIFYYVYDQYVIQLTGLWPFYDNEDDSVVQNKVSAGEQPYIDPRYQNRSYEEQHLVEIMKQGWEHDPNNRISIFDLVQLLRKAVSENPN